MFENWGAQHDDMLVLIDTGLEKRYGCRPANFMETMMDRFERHDRAIAELNKRTAEAMQYAKDNPCSLPDLQTQIQQATSIHFLNKLRGLVVEAKNPNILKIWQDQYRKLKRR